MPTEPERLPAFVALEELLPAQAVDVTVEDLGVPFGKNAVGQIVAFDPTQTPQGIVAGETGAGKTVGLMAIATSALVRGWDVAVAEVTKGGLRFWSIRGATVGERIRLDNREEWHITTTVVSIRRYGDDEWAGNHPPGR